jgi:hypothetical protein
VWQTAEPSGRRASVARIFKGRTMFNFRPYVPGFNVEPPADAEVPGFRMNADGSVRTDGAPFGRPPSYIPVGWTPNADAYGNAEIALSNSYGPSYWRDVGDGVEQFGAAAKAVGKGASSLVAGVDNLGRAIGRGTGSYGEEEAQRIRQEMNAAGEGLRLIAENPGQSADLAIRGTSKALERYPMLPFHLGGRLGMSVLLGSFGLPFALLPPLAMAGDTFHALEKGHDVIDAIG